MAHDQATAARIRDHLSGRTDVVEKRMVGGLSFLVGGVMCCGVTRNALMIRVPREARDNVLTEPHVRPMTLGGKPLASYVLVDPLGFATDAALATWLERAIEPSDPATP